MLPKDPPRQIVVIHPNSKYIAAHVMRLEYSYVYQSDGEDHTVYRHTYDSYCNVDAVPTQEFSTDPADDTIPLKVDMALKKHTKRMKGIRLCKRCTASPFVNADWARGRVLLAQMSEFRQLPDVRVAVNAYPYF